MGKEKDVTDLTIKMTSELLIKNSLGSLARILPEELEALVGEVSILAERLLDTVAKSQKKKE
jgi:hypothetical protein